MRIVIQPVKRLCFQILLLLCCYFFSRCIFTVINISHFSGLSLGEFLLIALRSTRFDVSAILILNLLYVALLFVPLPLWRMQWWDGLLQTIFVLVNSIALAFEMSDWVYYQFTLKRATADVLDMVTRKSDFWLLLPHFIVDFWYVPLAFAALIFCIVQVNKKIVRATPVDQRPSQMSYGLFFLIQFARLAIVVGLCVIGIRGGLQTIPIGNTNALQAAENRYTPIVLNTPFSIIHSLENDELPELHYYTDEELLRYFNPIKQYMGKPFTKKNVVVIVLESFSKEFTGFGRKSYTPFFDSLMQQGYTFRKAYSNALHSAEGVPAVLAGIPSLMEEPITTSFYGNDRITAFPTLLKPEGYSTAFFHGGNNGTMSFDIFAANAGFDAYYGRNEYPNDKDYDGIWGIWDEPYLQYFAGKLSAMKEPFMASVFTVSSHDPFKVPKQYESILPKGALPIHQTIAYADMALRKFFATASKQSWFRNTLFVLTPDHASMMSEDPNSGWNTKVYSIPMIFYAPGDTMLKGGTDTLIQQIDILPTVMDYLGYSKPFFAFGSSIFRNGVQRFNINELNHAYQFVMDGYLLRTKGMEPDQLFDLSKEVNGDNELLQKKQDAPVKRLNPWLKAYVQLYNNTLIHDKMYVK